MKILSERITIPQAASALLATVYLSGFLVLNAHLGKYGVFAFDLASFRYLIAGTLFLAFLVVWYLFPGKEVVFGKKWFAQELDANHKKDMQPSWDRISFVNSIVRILFMTCLAASLFSTALMGLTEAMPFYYYLMVLFLVAYPWDFLNLDIRYPRANLVFELGTKALGILVFLVGINLPEVLDSAENAGMILFLSLLTSFSSPTMGVFWSFMAISLYVNLVLDSLERYKITTERIAYNVIYSVIFVLLSSAAFGRLQYEHIESAVGGGELQLVEIIIDGEKTRDGLKDMGFEATPFLSGSLVYEGQREFVVNVGDQTIRLSREVVAGVRVLPAEDAHWLRRFIEAVRREGGA